MMAMRARRGTTKNLRTSHPEDKTGESVGEDVRSFVESVVNAELPLAKQVVSEVLAETPEIVVADGAV